MPYVVRMYPKGHTFKRNTYGYVFWDYDKNRAEEVTAKYNKDNLPLETFKSKFHLGEGWTARESGVAVVEWLGENEFGPISP